MEAKMTVREKLIVDMTAAFKLWEERYRANPEHFMDDAATKATSPGDLGEIRAIFFARLLDEVSALSAG